MKHLKTFEESIFGLNIKKPSFKWIITYNVTHVKKNKPDDIKPIGKWTTKDFRYVLKGDTKEEVENNFVEIWNKRISGYHPSPTLNILSIEKTDDNSKMFDIEKGLINPLIY